MVTNGQKKFYLVKNGPKLYKQFTIILNYLNNKKMFAKWPKWSTWINNLAKQFNLVNHYSDGQKWQNLVQNGETNFKWIQYCPKTPTIVKTDTV